ncbi:MAG TPA: hypothetical protein VGV59_11955 [Pyrinomonadaceae bacterium]|nr:hypothetical protein [Pyrinomonadaceae bacterium]
MNSSQLELVALWTQIGVTVLAFLLGIYQLRKVVQSIKSQTYQNIYELMISIDKFFIENPKMRSLIYGAPRDGEPPSGDVVAWDAEVDGKSVYAVAEMVIDYFDNVYHQQKVMPSETFEPFSKFMRYTYSRSPILQEFLKNNCEWYPEDFREHLMGDDD